MVFGLWRDAPRWARAGSQHGQLPGRAAGGSGVSTTAASGLDLYRITAAPAEVDRLEEACEVIHSLLTQEEIPALVAKVGVRDRRELLRVLREGSDVLFVGFGPIVARAVEAADVLVGAVNAAIRLASSSSWCSKKWSRSPSSTSRSATCTFCGPGTRPPSLPVG